MFPINGSDLGPGGSIRRESRDRIRVKSEAKDANKTRRGRLLLIDSYNMLLVRYLPLVTLDFIAFVRSKGWKSCPIQISTAYPTPFVDVPLRRYLANQHTLWKGPHQMSPHFP